MPLKLVIFDCDGVLVDSEAITNEIIAENLSRHGLPLSPEDCETLFVGGTIRGVGAEATRRGAKLGPNWLEEIYRDIYARLAEGTPVISGVVDVLDLLDQRGIPYCVASNGSEEKMDITLGQNGLAPRFAGRRYSAHRLKVAKPDPGLFLAAVQDFDLSPADCVVVEDSATGATAAARAGIPCFAYVASGSGDNLTAAGATVFHDMADLPGLLSLDEVPV